VHYVDTNYGQDISNELQNKIKHGLREAMIRSGQQNIQRAREAQYIILEAEVLAKDPDAPMKLAILHNEISQGDFSSSNEVEMELNSVMNVAPFGSGIPI
jgi:hypothetical protein